MSRSEDFSSISPSAKSLLLLKATTDIPFAKETAALMEGTEVFDLNFADKDMWFWLRVMHFEVRYKSIDLLLAKLQPRHVLEISSGYSLRGLQQCINHPELHYIDTDLPEVIKLKQQMVAALHIDEKTNGRFVMEALNVMDEEAVKTLLSRFTPGGLTIVNEGLLMYLDLPEKEQLCKTIHAVLKERGGYWITGDVYVKIPEEMRRQMPKSNSEKAFTDQHQIEENKFDSYEAAHAFFAAQGFEFVEEAAVNMGELSILPELLKTLPPALRGGGNPPPKIQATWMLRAV